MSVGSWTGGIPGSGLAAAAADTARLTTGSAASVFWPTLDFERPARRAREKTESRALEITGLLLRSLNSLGKVPDQIVEIFDADGETDEVLRDSGGELLLVGELLVGGRGRVDDQALGVSEIGQMGEDLDGVDELGPGGGSA